MYLFDEVKEEQARARSKFKPFNSAHEGLAVIEEEFLELRSAIFWGVDQYGDVADPRYEALQLAASALSLIVEVYDKEV